MLQVIWILVIFGCFQCIATNSAVSSYEQDWTTFPDDRGNLQYISLNINNTVLRDLSKSRKFFLKSTRFWLYTRKNKDAYEELFVDKDPRNDTYFMVNKPLVMVTHGWKLNGHSNSTQFIKNEYLKYKDVNVIVVDWQPAACNIYILASYLTELVGEEIKDMVLTLIQRYHFDINDLHLIGHSLGSHVVGRAGNALKGYKAIVPRITGLDPARPLFEFPKIFPGITKDDANFVDIIHTNIGVFGYIGAVGHADFFPNGGFYQTHCRHAYKFVSDHLCAYVYFAESLSILYTAYRCPSYEDFRVKNCDRVDFMGMPCSTKANGKYYLDID